MFLQLLDAFILWVHLFSAVLFVGGSFFMWLVVVPASHHITQDESERTRIVGRIAKVFGRVTVPTLVLLILTGIYNISWYLPSTSFLTTVGGLFLLVKMILVALLLVMISIHNVHFGKRIVTLAGEGKLDELRLLRRRSRLVSFTNLALMIAILALSVMMQFPP